jgi:nucleoid-associated protein YgaU
MARTRVRRRRVAAVLVGVGLAALLAGSATQSLAGASEPDRTAGYVVREGDTLWIIAERVSGGGDPRPLVDDIATLNGVKAGELRPGQRLRVPLG